MKLARMTRRSEFAPGGAADARPVTTTAASRPCRENAQAPMPQRPVAELIEGRGVLAIAVLVRLPDDQKPLRRVAVSPLALRTDAEVVGNLAAAMGGVDEREHLALVGQADQVLPHDGIGVVPRRAEVRQ